MIFFFTYFWVATMFQPSQIAEDLKRNGGYIPGVRPGKPTADFLDFTMTRLTFAGAIFLTIDLRPAGGCRHARRPASGLAGAPVLRRHQPADLVGVVLDVMRQVETHLLQRHYDGFLRKGKLKGRYDRLSQGTTGPTSSTAIVLIWAFIGVLLIIGAIAWIAK